MIYTEGVSIIEFNCVYS